MFQRENHNKSYACPDCGEKLLNDRDLYVCKEHGAFFAYGPQLLVRAARGEAKSEVLLPWENARANLA